VFVATFAVVPAEAQFGTIFNDSPPRPPADVPNGAFPPQPPPVQYPGQQYSPPPQYPGRKIPRRVRPPAPGAAIAATSRWIAGSASGGCAQHARAGQSAAAAACRYVAAAGRYGRHRDADAKDRNGRAVFAGLDKITGRTISFDAAIGETVQFGALQVTARACYTRPPTEATNTDAFCRSRRGHATGRDQADFYGLDVRLEPGSAAVEHPIYDIWLTDCAQPVGGLVAQSTVPPVPAAGVAPPPAKGKTGAGSATPAGVAARCRGAAYRRLRRLPFAKAVRARGHCRKPGDRAAARRNRLRRQAPRRVTCDRPAATPRWLRKCADVR